MKGYFYMNEKNNLEDANSFITGIWSERVLVITKDYQIKGDVFKGITRDQVEASMNANQNEKI